MRSTIERLFASACETRQRWLPASWTLAALMLMGVSICDAQGARPVRVLRKGTNLAGTTLKPLCFDKQSWRDTLRISLRHSPLEDAWKPHYWPDILDARVVRETDDIRHGVHFPRYQLIALGRHKTLVFGEFGLLYPDEEQMANSPRDPAGCMPAGKSLLGQLAKEVRLRP
jgi:hypothetical protein